MAAKMVGSVEGLRQDVEEVRAAGARLFDRLADRAAYAGSEEYQEIRSLMTALRVLGERVDTVMARAMGEIADAGSAGSNPAISLARGAHPGGEILGGSGAGSAA